MKNHQIQTTAETDVREIQVEFEKGKFWALTLPGYLHPPLNGNGKKLLVTLRPTQAEKLISRGMECNLLIGNGNAIPGILNKISSDKNTLCLEITPVNGKADILLS